MQTVLRLGLAVVAALGCTRPPDAHETYRRELLVPGVALHGIHGLAFDDAGRLYAGSVLGQSIFAIDVGTGAVERYVGPRKGAADDLEWGPPGTPSEGLLVWTGVATGDVYARRAGGSPTRIARGLPAVNSLAFDPSGRLFVAQVFGPDALWEIDPTGTAPPREIARDLGDLNGFDVGPDGRIYGPLWSKGQVAAVDVESGDLEVIATGFSMPAAANFDSLGNLYVADTARGEIVHVDIENGQRTRIARVRTAIDNIAVDEGGNVYVSVMADNAVHRVDAETGEVETIIESPLATAADIRLVHEEGKDWLYVADTFKLARVDVSTGQVEDVARVLETQIQFPMHVDVTPEAIAVSSTFVDSVQVLERDALETRRATRPTWRCATAPAATAACGWTGCSASSTRRSAARHSCAASIPCGLQRTCATRPCCTSTGRTPKRAGACGSWRPGWRTSTRPAAPASPWSPWRCRPPSTARAWALVGDKLVADELAAGRLVRPFDPSLSTPLSFSYYLLSREDRRRTAQGRGLPRLVVGGGEHRRSREDEEALRESSSPPPAWRRRR